MLLRATSSDLPNLTLLVLLETVRRSPVFSDSVLELGTRYLRPAGTERMSIDGLRDEVELITRTG